MGEYCFPLPCKQCWQSKNKKWETRGKRETGLKGRFKLRAAEARVWWSRCPQGTGRRVKICFSLTTAETFPSVFKFCSGFVHPHLSGPRSSWFWSLADICLFYLEAKNGNLEPGRSLALMALERKAGRVRGLCGHGLILSDLLLGPGADVYFHGWN